MKICLLQVKYDLNLIQGHYPGERLKPDNKSLQLIEVNNVFHKTLYDARMFSQTMYLLTKWEGRIGKYLARGHSVRTERSEVRAP